MWEKGCNLKVLVSLLFLFLAIETQASGDRILYKEEVQCPQTPEAVSSLLEDVQTIQQQFKDNLNCQEINIQFDKLTSILDGTMVQEGSLNTIIIEIEKLLANLRGANLEVTYINEKTSLISSLLTRSYLTQDNLVQIMVEIRALFLDIPAQNQYFEVVHGIEEVLSKFINSEPGNAVPARQDFLNLIFNNQGTTVSVADAQKIQTYTSAVTEEAGVLISMIADAAAGKGPFWNRNECQISPEDEWAATQRVTGVLYEAASFISKIAGPYGVPIQIGASVFSGAVQGFMSYKKRSRNVDFYEGEDGGLSTRQFYENAVCLLEKTNAEAQRILNPNRHLQRLLYVRSNVISEFRSAIPNSCSGCNEIAATLQTRSPVNSLDQMMQQRAQLSKPLSAIENIVMDLAVEEAINIDWLNKEIETFRSLASNSANGIGAAEVISNLEPVKNFLYETVTDDFFKYYQSRYRTAAKELNRQVRALVRVFDNELRVIDEEIDYMVLPEGFRDYVMQNNPLSNFEQQYFTEDDLDFLVLEELMTFQASYPSVYNLFVINSKARLLSRYSPHAVSMTLDSIRKWQEKDLNLRVITEYCDFFERVLQLNTSVQQMCTSEKTKVARLSVSYLAFSFSELLGIEQRGLVEDRDGPIDFNLEERVDVVKNLRLEVRAKPIFADLALDFEALITQEQEFRIFDDNISFLPERGEESYSSWHEAAVASFTERFSSKVDGISEQVPFLGPVQIP